MVKLVSTSYDILPSYCSSTINASYLHNAPLAYQTIAFVNNFWLVLVPTLASYKFYHRYRYHKHNCIFAIIVHCSCLLKDFFKKCMVGIFSAPMILFFFSKVLNEFHFNTNYTEDRGTPWIHRTRTFFVLRSTNGYRLSS